MSKVAIVLTLNLLMALTFSACGKKAKDSKTSTPEETRDEVKNDIVVENQKELLDAILIQDEKRAGEILDLDSQTNINKQLMDQDGETLLTLAVKYNLIQTAEKLIRKGASLTATNSRKETPIILAAMLGLEDMLKRLASHEKAKDAIDVKDKEGNTALHHAILKKYEKLAIYLVGKEADINITNNLNQTALMLAEIQVLPELLDILRTKLLVNVGLPSDQTVIKNLTVGSVQSIQSMFYKYNNLKIIYPKLNYHVLVIESQSHDDALTLIEFMARQGIDYHGPGGSAQTPLIASIKKDYVEFAEIMLKTNVNPNVIDSSGKSALIWAIEKNNPAMVKLLLDYNAAVKYDYSDNNRKKTMKACDVVKEIKKKVAHSEKEKANNAEIKNILGCSGFLGLF